MVRELIDTTLSSVDQRDLLHKAVRENNDPPRLYRFADRTIGLVERDPDTDEFVPITLNETTLNVELRKWADPVRPAQGQQGMPIVEPFFTDRLVKAYMDKWPWDGVPLVRRFAPAPLLRKDWSIAFETGYDTDSQVFVTTDSREIGVVTEDHVDLAKAWLTSLFWEFALVHKTSRADCIALMLTPLIMDIIPNDPVPAGVFMANRPGAGKTALAVLISLMATGRRATIRNLSGEKELERSVTSILRGGVTPVALFDNVKTDLSSSVLEGLITGREYGSRLLGKSEDLQLRNDTMWLFSMNSPSLSSDMLRRCVFVKLSPETVETEKPWVAGPIHNVENAIDDYRTSLAVLIRWWVQNGSKMSDEAPMVGFEQWSRIIGGILDCAGIEGFMEANNEAKDEVHTEVNDDADVLERIYELIQGDLRKGNEGTLQAEDGSFLARELQDLITDIVTIDPNALALKQWMSGRGGMSSKSIGHKLSGLVGKKLGDYRLGFTTGSGRKKWYKIEELNPSEAPRRNIMARNIDDIA